jgi:hypothetical protein
LLLLPLLKYCRCKGAAALALQDSAIQYDNCLQRLAILPPNFVCAVVPEELCKPIQLLRADVWLEGWHLRRVGRDNWQVACEEFCLG